MKIGFIPATFLPNVGGAEIQAHNLANKLIELGHNVEIFITGKYKEKNSFYKISKLNKYLINLVFLLKYYLFVDLRIVLKFYFQKKLLTNNFDLWHFHSLNYKTLMMIPILKQLKQKVIVTLQGADIQINKKLEYGYRLDKKYDILLKNVFKEVDQFHAISDDISNILLGLGIDRKKIFIIPNCTAEEKIKKYTKINNNKITLITVGRYAIKKKGFDMVVNVAKELNKLINYRWIIVGRGTKNLLKNKFIKNNAKKFLIRDEIPNLNERYFPHSTLIKLYKSCDAYINLARIEGCPLVLLDALSCHLPIITLNNRGSNEVVLNNINGFVINDMNFKVLARKVSKIKKFKINNKNSHIKKKIQYYDLSFNAHKILSTYKLIIN